MPRPHADALAAQALGVLCLVARDEAAAGTAARELAAALRWSDRPCPAPDLVHQVILPEASR